MTVCFPISENEGISSPLSDHFGRAPYFALVSIPSMAVEVIENAQEHSHTHGVGQHGACVPVALLQEKNVERVVCRGMGRGALTRMQEAHINVFSSTHTSLEEAMAALLADDLPRLDPGGSCRGREHAAP